MLRDTPAELLDNFKAQALGTLGVIGPHVDVDERPAVFAGNFRAEPVHFVVVAFDADDLGAVNQRVHHLALLEIGGNEDVGFESGRGGVRGDRVGQVAGRSAGDCGKTEFTRAAQCHAHDAVFERKGRVIDRVVFHPELAHAQSPGQLVGLNERRKADLETNGRITGHRQQLPVAPHGLWPRPDVRMIERRFDTVVIVNDFERAEVKFAHVRGGERIFATALAALERFHETSVFFHNLSLRRDAWPRVPICFHRRGTPSPRHLPGQ